MVEGCKTITLDVKTSATINKGKHMIRVTEGIPKKHQRVIFAEKQLEDSKTLGNYSLKGGETLYLLLCLAGGGKRGRHEPPATIVPDDRLDDEMRKRVLLLFSIEFSPSSGNSFSHLLLLMI